MLKLRVPEMSCGHCVKTIEAAVAALDPKARVICDLASKEVSIESSETPESIVAALAEAGYDSERLAA